MRVIVGVGAVLPDAPNAPAFWQNIQNSRYSISEVPDDRWDPNLYYDPDPKAPLKTYSKIADDKHHRGRLEAADDDSIVILVDGEDRHIEFADIAAARTVFVWEKGTKPGTKA